LFRTWQGFEGSHLSIWVFEYWVLEYLGFWVFECWV